MRDKKRVNEVIYPMPVVMEKKNPFVLKKKIFSSAQVDRILNVTNSSRKYKSVRKKYPRSVSFSYIDVSESEWLYRKMANSIALNNVWRLALTGISEEFRVLYYKKNDFTRAHQDYSENYFDQSKITFVIQLCEKSEYRGGELYLGEDVKPPKLDKGDCVIFPSYIMHGVDKVFSGERVVLTGWVSGPPLS